MSQKRFSGNGILYCRRVLAEYWGPPTQKTDPVVGSDVNWRVSSMDECGFVSLNGSLWYIYVKVVVLL